MEHHVLLTHLVDMVVHRQTIGWRLIFGGVDAGSAVFAFGDLQVLGIDLLFTLLLLGLVLGGHGPTFALDVLDVVVFFAEFRLTIVVVHIHLIT